jgi:hypothetical protein
VQYIQYRTLYRFSFFFVFSKISFSSFFFYFFFEIFDIISWNFVIFFCYILLIREIWRFLLNLVCIQWGTLSGRSYMEYCQQKQQDSSTEDTMVKEDNSQKLKRSQNSVYLKCVIIAGYDWEYLIEEMICELAVSCEVFTYRFLFFVFIFSFYFYIGFLFLRVLIWYKIRSTVGP